MTDEVKEAEQTEGFDKSFDEFATAPDGASEKAEKAEVGEPTEKGAVKEEGKETQGEEKGKKDEKATAVQEKKEEETKVEPVSKADYEKLSQQYNTLQGMFNQVNKQLKEIKKGEEAEPGDKGKGKQKEDAPTPSLDEFFTKLYDDLDDLTKKNLKLYDDEFDVHSKSEGIKRDHALKKVVKFVQTQNRAMIDDSLKVFAKSVQKYLEPFVARVDQTTESAHYTALNTALPNFEKYRDDGSLKAWIEGQPKIIRAAYQKVYSDGTTEDTVEMLGAFAAAKGIGKQEKKEEKTEEDKSKESRVRDLEQVRSKSTGVNISSGADNKNDFDSAWDEANKKANARR